MAPTTFQHSVASHSVQPKPMSNFCLSVNAIPHTPSLSLSKHKGKVTGWVPDAGGQPNPATSGEKSKGVGVGGAGELRKELIVLCSQETVNRNKLPVSFCPSIYLPNAEV